MEFISDIITKPWPWYIGGPLIGLFVITLLLVEKKQLGISSSLQYVCGRIFPTSLDYFKKENISKAQWQVFFVTGLIIGGVVCSFIPKYTVDISSNTQSKLLDLGVVGNKGFYPSELFGYSLKNLLVLFLGGGLIGFGARYANGCTAGHAIMGVSQLSVASIVSTACFFIGGLLATHLLLPLIF